MKQLPAGYGVRPATLESPDLAAVLALWIDVDVAAVGVPASSADDVHAALSDPRLVLASDTWLVTGQDGRLVAYATVLDRNGSELMEGDLCVHPGLAPTDVGAAIGEDLVDAIERRAVDIVSTGALDAADVSFMVLTGDARATGWLAAAGYENVRRFSRMEVALTGDERPPALIDGVRIRVADASDAGRRTVHRLLFDTFAGHFGTATESYDAWSARMAARVTADPAQWWVAELDGEPVGLVMGDEQYADENGGWVKNLGVLQEHRGRGLGRALLQHALAEFARRGRVKAGLGVDTGNETGALALYESVGMRPLFQADVWQRRIPVLT